MSKYYIRILTCFAVLGSLFAFVVVRVTPGWVVTSHLHPMSTPIRMGYPLLFISIKTNLRGDTLQKIRFE